jgi:hypothetical protein
MLMRLWMTLPFALLACARPAISPTPSDGTFWNANADAIATDLGIPLLRDRLDGAAVREIRIWQVSGGDMTPEGMVQVLELRHGANGHRWMVWPRNDGGANHHSHNEPGLLDVEGWRRRASAAECSEVRAGEHYVGCAIRKAHLTDWNTAIHALDSLDVSRTPALGHECPPDMDGWTTVVEVRTPTRYVHYECGSAEVESRDAESRRIGLMMRMAWTGPNR